MGLEATFNNIDDLDPVWPTDNDPVDEGDDHLRGIKNALKGNVTGDANVTRFVIGDGVKVVGLANASGISALSPDDATPLAFAFRNAADDADLAALQINAGTELFLKNNAPGKVAVIQLRNLADDADIDSASFDPEGAAVFKFGATDRAATSDTGFQVAGTALDLFNQVDDALTAFVFLNTAGGGRLSSDAATATVSLNQLSAAGAVEGLFAQFVRGAGSALYFNLLRRLETTNVGALISRSGQPQLDFENTAEAGPAGSIFGSLAAGFSFQSEGTVYLRSNGGDISVRGLSGGNTDLYTGGVQRMSALASSNLNSFGSVNIASGSARSIGFNNLAEGAPMSGGRDVAVGDNGHMVRFIGGGDILNLVSIGSGSVVQCFNAASGSSAILSAPAGLSLTWLQGGTGVTGDRTLAPQSVCTLWQRTGSTWYVWGNGLS